MTDLERKLQEAAQKYYTDGTSDLTDEEFDNLVDQLRKEQPDSILFRVGWGYDVSSDNTPGMKRKHLYTTIGSLDKCHNLKELGKDFIGIHLDASTKLDGLSCVLYYENSLLKYALTRGDSFTGIDITDKVLKINPDFAVTKIPFTGAIRGEILMSFTNFEKFHELHSDAKNPRNSTAGIINGKDTFEDLKFLNIVLYTLVHDDETRPEVRPYAPSVTGTRQFIRDLFKDTSIEVVPYMEVCYPYTIEFGDLQFIEEMEKLKSKLYQDYPADGIVLSRENITCTNGNFNYVAKAFKFPAESKVTRIVDVEWNMGKTKIAVPKILLEPVQLSGTTVQACAGYNAQYIQENNLGPGSLVEVRKSGEIIPKIIKIHESTTAKLPDVCPECGHELVWEGVHLKCPNPECSSSIEQDLLIWLQYLVPTDNLGDTLKMKFINQMVDNRQIEDCSIESVMECKMKFDEDTPSSQFNTFAKMWNQLHDSNKKFDLVRALCALNVPRIGDLTAMKLARFPDLIQPVISTKTASTYNADSFPLSVFVNCIGSANAHSIQEHLSKFQRLALIEDRIIWSTGPKVEFKGKVAITGKLSVKRSDFEEELRRHGYEPSDTVNKDTKYLITDSPNSSSSKNTKASQLGIPKINEFDFRLKYLS